MDNMEIDRTSDGPLFDEVVKEVDITGNNKWFAFFEYSGDTGFFRINQLHIDKASGFARKVFTDINDLDDFISGQGEGCRVWAKIKSYDPEVFDEDVKFLTLADGTKVNPRWRSDLVWVGSEVEPKCKIPVFHVEHPDTRVVQIELIGNSEDTCDVIKFELDGKMENGYIKSNKVYVKGKKVPKYQIKTIPRLAAFLEKQIETIWAAVVPEICSGIDGEMWTTRWHTTKIWVGQDSSPPPVDLADLDSGGIVKKIEKFHAYPLPNLDTIDVAVADTIGSNLKCRIVAIHRDMVLLKVDSSVQEVEFKGKLVVLARSRMFLNGKPPKKRLYILENVKVGDVFTCNVAPKPSDINLLQPTEIWDKSELLAVIGWTGTKIPDLDIFESWHLIRRESKRCQIVCFVQDSEGRYIGGVAQLWNRTESQNIQSNIRIWFEREDTFLFDTCLAKTDLGYFADLNSCVHVFYDESEVMSDTSVISDHNIPLKNFIWHRAYVSSLGQTVQADHLFDQSNKFKFDPSMKDLKDYLERRNISVDDFQLHVDGFLLPMNKAELDEENKMAQQLEDEEDYEDEGIKIENVPKGCSLAKIIDLEKPLRLDLPVETCQVLITFGPFEKSVVSVSRSRIDIYGHKIGQANLMDVLKFDDQFLVEWIDDCEPQVKSMWKGPLSDDLDEKVYKSKSFKTWMQRHNFWTVDVFHQMVNGSLRRKPYFPITPFKVENRVNAIVKFVSCSMEENQMSKPFVIVEVLDGKWEKKVAVFDTDDFYIFGVNIRSGDVRQLLKYGDKVVCEVKPLEEGHLKEEWRQKLLKKKREKNIEYLALACTLVYVGGRPRPSTRPQTLHDYEQNNKLKDFLRRRQITLQMFEAIVSGKASSVEASSTVEASKEISNQGLQLAEILTRRAMSCVNLDDPNVAKVVTNTTEMETALFLAKTLEASAMQFQSRGKRRGAPSNLSGPIYPTSDRGQKTNYGSRGGPVSGYRGGYDLGPSGYSRGRGQSHGYGVAQPLRGSYGEPPSKRGRGGHRGRGFSNDYSHYSEYDRPY